MSAEIIMELVLTVITGAAFVWGDYKFFKKGVALYLQMVTLAIGCVFLARIFETIQVYRDGEVPFISIALFGVVAEFIFFFCANFGVIDSLCDDGSVRFLKYRLAAAIVPVALFVFLIFRYKSFSAEDEMAWVIYIPVTVILLAMYYHIKHLIIPDVPNGIVRRIRLYNLIGIINCLTTLTKILTDIGDVYWYVSLSLCCISTVIMLPVLSRGVSRWILK